MKITFNIQNSTIWHIPELPSRNSYLTLRVYKTWINNLNYSFSPYYFEIYFAVSFGDVIFPKVEWIGYEEYTDYFEYNFFMYMNTPPKNCVSSNLVVKYNDIPLSKPFKTQLKMIDGRQILCSDDLERIPPIPGNITNIKIINGVRVEYMEPKIPITSTIYPMCTLDDVWSYSGCRYVYWECVENGIKYIASDKTVYVKPRNYKLGTFWLALGVCINYLCGADKRVPSLKYGMGVRVKLLDGGNVFSQTTNATYVVLGDSYSNDPHVRVYNGNIYFWPGNISGGPAGDGYLEVGFEIKRPSNNSPGWYDIEYYCNGRYKGRWQNLYNYGKLTHSDIRIMVSGTGPSLKTNCDQLNCFTNFLHIVDILMYKTPSHIYQDNFNPEIEVGADFVPIINSSTVPVNIEFKNSSSGVERFEWDFGDGTTSTEENPTHTYTEPGIYTPILKAWDSEQNLYTYEGNPIYVMCYNLRRYINECRTKTGYINKDYRIPFNLLAQYVNQDLSECAVDLMNNGYITSFFKEKRIVTGDNVNATFINNVSKSQSSDTITGFTETKDYWTNVLYIDSNNKIYESEIVEIGSNYIKISNKSNLYNIAIENGTIFIMFSITGESYINLENQDILWLDNNKTIWCVKVDDKVIPQLPGYMSYGQKLNSEYDNFYWVLSDKRLYILCMNNKKYSGKIEIGIYRKPRNVTDQFHCIDFPIDLIHIPQHLTCKKMHEAMGNFQFAELEYVEYKKLLNSLR